MVANHVKNPTMKRVLDKYFQVGDFVFEKGTNFHRNYSSKLKIKNVDNLKEKLEGEIDRKF